MTDAEIAAAAAAKAIADQAAADAAAKVIADKAAADAAAAAEVTRLATEKAAADAAAAAEVLRLAEEAKKTKKPEGMSDNEWKLLKETMERKAENAALAARLKEFEGIDPAQARLLAEQKTAAETAQRAAELKAAETAGNFGRVKELMNEEQAKIVGTKDTEIASLKALAAGKDATIGKLTVGHEFKASKYVAEELVLPPSVSELTFGPHFEFDAEKSTVVGYDKPKGAAERTLIVDAAGNPLPFSEAMKKIVAAHPDRDGLLRDKMKTGARSTGVEERKVTTVKPAGSGVDRIAAAIPGMQKVKKK